MHLVRVPEESKELVAGMLPKIVCQISLPRCKSQKKIVDLVGLYKVDLIFWERVTIGAIAKESFICWGAHKQRILGSIQYYVAIFTFFLIRYDAG